MLYFLQYGQASLRTDCAHPDCTFAQAMQAMQALLNKQSRTHRVTSQLRPRVAGDAILLQRTHGLALPAGLIPRLLDALARAVEGARVANAAGGGGRRVTVEAAATAAAVARRTAAYRDPFPNVDPFTAGVALLQLATMHGALSAPGA